MISVCSSREGFIKGVTNGSSVNQGQPQVRAPQNLPWKIHLSAMQKIRVNLRRDHLHEDSTKFDMQVA